MTTHRKIRGRRGRWPHARRALAVMVAAGWLALLGYWLVSGDDPACQVTTVISAQGHATVRTVTTRTCSQPGMSASVPVLVFVALLLLPDMQRVKIGGVEFERRLNEIAEAAQVTEQVRQGDVIDDSAEAKDVIGDLLRGGS